MSRIFSLCQDGQRISCRLLRPAGDSTATVIGSLAESWYVAVLNGIGTSSFLNVVN